MCCQGLNMPPSKFRQWNGKAGPEDIRGGALKGSLVKGLLVDEGSSKGPSFTSCRLSALLPREAQPLSLGCTDFLKVETGFCWIWTLLLSWAWHPGFWKHGSKFLFFPNCQLFLYSSTDQDVCRASDVQVSAKEGSCRAPALLLPPTPKSSH